MMRFYQDATWIWASSWENLFSLYANNNGADQPSDHTFVVRSLDSIIPAVAMY